MADWKRIQDKENDSIHRFWKNPETEDQVRVEKFKDGTWDTFRNDRLVENFDTTEEAIERAREEIN